MVGGPGDGAGVSLSFVEGGEGPGSVSGSILVGNGNAFTISTLQVEFGDGQPSIFVDDDTYAATGLGGSVDGLEVLSESARATYFVSSNLATSPGITEQILELCSDCEFAEWGEWGTRITGEYTDTMGTEDEGDDVTYSIDAVVSAGFWVAGDLVDNYADVTADLGLTGLAYYSGFAVGNSVTTFNASGDTPIYVQQSVVGSVDITWDLGSASGIMTIDNFGGKSAGGFVDTIDSTAYFEGDLVGPGVTGHASGSFVYADVGEVGDLAGGGAIGDFTLDGANYTASGIFVASLDDIENTPTTSLGTLTGFSAGMVTSQTGDYASGPVPFISGLDEPGITLAFSPGDQSLSGTIVVNDASSSSPLASLSADFGGSPASSAYFNDDIYAAEATPGGSSHVDLDNGHTVSETPETPAKTYVASAEVAAPKGVDPEAVCSQCSFMQWGVWGTQIEGTDDGAPVDASVNQGTWVAGEVPDVGDLPTTGGATYSGSAVGNVVNAGAEYGASGNMDMTWDFGDRSGRWDVSDFDGKNFGADIADPGTTATFAGDVTGDAFGSVNGAFVADGPDPVAGVMGNFGVTDGADWSASGVFMGAGGLDP